MDTRGGTNFPEMQVTSIRLETELKQRLKELSGNQGYQALIRDVLWDYVQQSGFYQPQLSPADIRASWVAIAEREERCVLTGKPIRPQERMRLGLTTNGQLVPICIESWESGGRIPFL